MDKKILTLNRKRIFHKLNSNIPKIFGGTENPQAKILAGEFTRKSGHMPVRKLLEKAGGMIKQIKPCFMMSPLSIAQYLDPTNEELQFDVVIFDEASQVKPEDALGAFMRGKTAVVMGDTQQLPPTSFFDQMSDADSDEEEATSLDMESILHLCKLSFPVKMLKWHYRSRHESLITVSNREFYDNDLLVYPSPSHSDPELGLKFHYNPNTQYLRGASSKNPLEADDVVEEIFNHFEKYGDTKSLGVGTFSVAQKNAILEALEVKRKEHPEYEPLFSDNKEERFFVKNLETIQGDERDVILISVGYGYDQDGKMSLNFGPLNQDGGERRLNVLITRAREKCVVFSNFKAYDMNLTANPPYGVKSLKEFLEYAENLTLGTSNTDEYSKEPFEDAIASFLQENGYTVDRQIGCAGFRVDLAIVDDENPGKYILGITTDGKMYSSSKVARDRDRLREQVLTGLGWKLYHLWSTDWYRNRDLGRKKLLEFVEKSIRQTREEEKRRSEEEKKLAEKRRIEAEKKAEELRLAREREEKEKAEKEAQEDEINPEDIGPADFVEVEKVDDGDILEKPIDVSEIDPKEFFEDDDAVKKPVKDNSINEDNVQKDTPSEFVTVEDIEEDKPEFKPDESEFVGEESIDEQIEDLENIKTESINQDYDDGVDAVDDIVVEQVAVSSDSSNENVSEFKDEDFDDNVDEVSAESVDSVNDTVSESNDIDFDDNVDEVSVEGVDSVTDAVSESKDIGFDDGVNVADDVSETTDSVIDNASESEDEDFDDLQDNKEVWESQEEPADKNDDAEVWEDDEEISPEDNAEVWEDDTDYADEHQEPKSFKQIVKDLFRPEINEDEEQDNHKSSIFSGLKFHKDLGKNSVFEDDSDERIPDEDIDEGPAKQSDKVDLGSDDDYIYVDHSNDEVADESDFDDFNIEDYASKVDDEPVTEEYEEPVIEENDDTIFKEEKTSKQFNNIKKPVFSDKINIEHDEPSQKVANEHVDVDDGVDLGSDDVNVDVDVDDGAGLSSDDVNVKEDVNVNDGAGLGSDDVNVKEDVNVNDDDYIYVDHSDDEISEEEEDDYDVDEIRQNVRPKTKSKRASFVKQIFSDVVSGESQLEPEEIETVRGVVIDEEIPSHRPAPSDDNVVEAEIVTGDTDYSQDIPLEKPTPKKDYYFEEDEELNIFNDELPDLSHDEYDEIHDEAERVFDKAMDEFMDEVFSNKESPLRNESANPFKVENEDEIFENNEPSFENRPEAEDDSDSEVPKDNEDMHNFESSIEDRYVDEEIVQDSVSQIQENESIAENTKTAEDTPLPEDVYFKGATDVTNPLRKNNVYYKNEHKKSLKDSIKGIKKDMQYINKSLNEIENPTQIDYVSVVDRTEEYDPNEYLSKPSDDDSDKIIQMEEELAGNGFESDFIEDDVIVNVNHMPITEEQKDQALEDIIQSANEDYKEIEKERFHNNNKLKAFDDKKLPGKKSLEDEIIDYVQVTDIGLNSQNELYSQPISNISKSIVKIVDIEGPIHVKEVTKRVKDSCHIKRAGSNLKKTVQAAVSEAESSGDIIRIGDFLYDASNNNVVIRRRQKPNIELISDEEIAKSIELVLLHKGNVSTKHIAKETSRNFGFKSTSKKTAARINGVLDLMIANNRVKIVNDYVELN